MIRCRARLPAPHQLIRMIWREMTYTRSALDAALSAVSLIVRFGSMPCSKSKSSFSGWQVSANPLPALPACGEGTMPLSPSGRVGEREARLAGYRRCRSVRRSPPCNPSGMSWCRCPWLAIAVVEVAGHRRQRPEEAMHSAPCTNTSSSMSELLADLLDLIQRQFRAGYARQPERLPEFHCSIIDCVGFSLPKDDAFPASVAHHRDQSGSAIIRRNPGRISMTGAMSAM